MDNIARTFILIGVLLVAGGLWWHFSGGKFPLGNLPGDIRLNVGSGKVYIPLTSCIVVSVLFTVLSWFFRR